MKLNNMLIGILLLISFPKIYAQNFYLHPNGVTCMCPNAAIGETGVVNGVTYTKRTVNQITPQNATTTCTSGITNMSGLFANIAFNGDISSWDVSNVVYMNLMFYNSQFNKPISDWDVSNVVNMKEMFRESQFNQPIEDWDVSNVTDMSYMFLSSPFNQPIGNWNVSNVTNMARMFQYCDFNKQISDWNVGNVIDMQYMFYGSQFNKPIGNWDVSNVGNMARMFTSSPFNQPIGDWDVSNVIDMSMIFYSSSFNQPIGNWDVSAVTNMSKMFALSLFNQPIGDWDVSAVTNMSEMFKSSPFNQPIGDWNVSSVTNMTGMFWLSDFNQPIGNWDVSKITDMSIMFSSSPFNKPISDWDVSSVANMHRLFESSSFNQPLANWDVSNVTDMSIMFSNSSFNQSISDWNVSNVTDMSMMFASTPFNHPIGNWDVENVINMSDMFVTSQFNHPIGNWNVSNVLDMSHMFWFSQFNQPIGDWNVSNVTDMRSMFSNSLFNQPIAEWDVSNVVDMYKMFGNSPFNQPISEWDVSSVTDMSEMFYNSSFNQDISAWIFNPDISFSSYSYEFLNGSVFSIQNYDLLLQSFSNQNLQDKIFPAYGLVYCNSNARNDLINNKGWSITGDGTIPTDITAPNDLNLIAEQGSCEISNVDLGSPIAQSCLSYTISNNAPANFPLGTTEVIWTITNADGVSDSDTQIVLVTTPDGATIYPTDILAPTDLNLIAEQGSCEVSNVDLGSPVAQSCLSYTISNNAPVIFPLGTTEVIWIITDADGVSDWDSQIVLVTTPDGATSIPTTITAPNSLTVSADQGSCVATNVDLGESIAQSCLDYTISNNAPEIFPLGLTQIIWTITDVDGTSVYDFQDINVTIDVDEASVCYVSSDDVDVTKNRIYIRNSDWRKVVHYEVLRESSAGYFEQIGNLTQGEISFLDLSSNNASQTYRYSVRTLDSCDHTSLASPYHRTVLLQSGVAVNNTVNLSWTDYEGVSFDIYKIYRRINEELFELIATLPSTTNVYTDTEANVTQNNYEYYIAIEIQPCDNSLRLNSAEIKSNKAIIGTGGILDDLLTNKTIIHPNPILNTLNILLPTDVAFISGNIYNTFGQQVMTVNSTSFSVAHLAPASYYIKILTSKGPVTKIFVKF